MKKILLIISSFIILSSCVDMLNLAPTNQIASGNMWTTETLIDKGMNGLYVNFYRKDLSRIQLRHNDFTGINRQGWMGMSFDVNYIGDSSSPLRALWYNSKVANDFVVWYEWKWAYTSIHQINEAIENVKDNPAISKEKSERYVAEAKFLRAWFYTRLNKIYGGTVYSSSLSGKTMEEVPSVPLYLRVISENECIQSQAMSSQVWAAIIEDLTSCIQCESFPTNTLTANYGRPSKGAAYALRGMAYMYLQDYQAAINDFIEVKNCGYDFWTGAYIDMFHHDNEKNSEMIFTIQYDESAGYCDHLQLMIGGRDTYDSWANIRPSSDFVDYFQNADGTKFKWTSVPGLEDWDILTPVQREVFFLRNGINSDNNPKTGKPWTSTQKSIFQERISKMGENIFNKYYLNNGNEERIRLAYNNRDPRLKDICLTPYDPYDTFKGLSDNGGKIQLGKELRWPFFSDLEGDDYGDYYIGDNQSMYLFKKFSYNNPDDLISRQRCHADWPLIRYTDVALQLAEAYVETNQLDLAADIVNSIRTRAGMPAVDVGSQNEMREAVRYERRIELCIECHNFFDEWRWGTYKEMKFQGNDIYGDQAWWKEWDGFREKWYYNDKMYPWPAPAQECQRNPNLIRTDGWTY